MRQILFAIAFAVTLGSISSAPAQEYPSRPITIVVPFAAGGPADALARIIFQMPFPCVCVPVIVTSPGEDAKLGAAPYPPWAREQSEHGGSIMPIFVTQGRLTREYVKGGLAKPEDRHAALSKLCEQAGGKLLSMHFTLGQYDFLVISEMPNAKAAAMLALAASGGGGVEGAVTSQAFTTAEAKDLFARAGKIAYKPMGAS